MFAESIETIEISMLRNEEDTEIPMELKDAIFLLHTKHTKSINFSAGAFAAAGVIRTTDVNIARKLYAKLQEIKVIRADGSLDTTKIDGRFNRHMVLLSISAQRRLIVLLFFWEEEVERMQRLLSIQNYEEMHRLPSQRIHEDVPTYHHPPPYALTPL